MARRKRTTQTISRQTRRGPSATSRPRSAGSVRSSYLRAPRPFAVTSIPSYRRFDLSSVEDNRLWSPYRPIASRVSRVFSGAPARISASQRPSGPFAHQPLYSSPRITFEFPSRTIVCIRRQVRRECLFARGRLGSGQRVKSPSRNQFSEISCRG